MEWAAPLRRISTPERSAVVTIALSGGLSAFMIHTTVRLRGVTTHGGHCPANEVRPDPPPDRAATAANVGSTGTITGNPTEHLHRRAFGPYLLPLASRLLPGSRDGARLT